jgi:type IV secretory pathway VirB10-like protein
MPASQQSWLDGRGPQAVVVGAIGVAALMLGASALRQGPQAPARPPLADVAQTKAPEPARPAPAPAPAPAPPPAPAQVEPAAPGPLERPSDPAAGASDRSTWERLLAKTDDYLVRQAIDAGCDASRVERLRAALAARRAARTADIAAAEAGEIDRKTLRRRSAQAQSSLEREIDQILTPAEQAALDAEAARARAVADER